jgi:hypothetical protein
LSELVTGEGLTAVLKLLGLGDKTVSRGVKKESSSDNAVKIVKCRVQDGSECQDEMESKSRVCQLFWGESLAAIYTVFRRDKCSID